MPVQMRPAQIDFSALANLGTIPERLRMRQLRGQFADPNAFMTDGVFDYNKMAQAVGVADPALGAKLYAAGQEADALAAYRNRPPEPDWRQDDSGNFYNANSPTLPVVAGGGNFANPYATPGKRATEIELKAQDAATRAAEAEKNIRKYKSAPQNEGWVSGAVQAIPDELGYVKRALSTDERNQLNYAADEFINAVSGKPAGTPVTPIQREAAFKQYIPLKGEPENIVKQKDEARMKVLEGLYARAGRNFVIPSLDDEPQIEAATPTQESPSGVRSVPTMSVAPDGTMTPTQPPVTTDLPPTEANVTKPTIAGMPPVPPTLAGKGKLQWNSAMQLFRDQTGQLYNRNGEPVSGQ